MFNKFGILFIFLSYIFINPITALAHPHTFIDCKVTVIFHKNSLAGFHNKWTMDPMFSENIIHEFAPGYDPDQLTLTQSDIKQIKKRAFDNLKNFKYFNHIYVNGHEVKDIYAQDFNAKATTNGLVYEFFIPFDLSAGSQSKIVKMSVYDSSFYASVKISSILFSESEALDITHTTGHMDEFTYYMGQFKAKGIAIQFKSIEENGQTVLPGESSEKFSYNKFVDKWQNSQKTTINNSFMQNFFKHVNIWQNYLKDTMTSFGNDIKKNYWSKSLFLFLLFSFFYGFVHALGPGHGKSIVTSYFVARPGNYSSGVLMAFILSITHVTSGAIFVFVIKGLFESSLLFNRALPVERVSYSLLIIIGLFVLIHAIIEMKKTENIDNTVPTNLKQIMFVAFATGLIPCPGAVLILVFSIALNIVFSGLIALLLMSIGMSLTTSMFALVAIASRNTVTKLTGANKKYHKYIHNFLSITGGILITLFGIFMFFCS